MKRIFLYLATNLAIVLVLGITLRLLGFERILDEQGVGLDINSLLLFAAVFGFGGSFISLAISRWMAKRATGAKVIETASNASEQGLLGTVRRQAEAVGIGMPEVAIYDAPRRECFCHRYVAQQCPGGGKHRIVAGDEPG
jgi:heat shock protein HtpX